MRILNCRFSVPQTQPIEAPEQRQKRGHARHMEPDGLVVRRGDGKIERCAGLVPHPAVIAGRDAEAVVARRKIVVERLPAVANVLPIADPAFQLVAKQDLFRRDQAERGVVDLQIADQRGQAQVRPEVAS